MGVGKGKEGINQRRKGREGEGMEGGEGMVRVCSEVVEDQ